MRENTQSGNGAPPAGPLRRVWRAVVSYLDQLLDHMDEYKRASTHQQIMERRAPGQYDDNRPRRKEPWEE